MDQIEEVRSKVDIVELINSYVPLKKAGRSFKAPCPFHQEKVPSFFVSPELQIYKCFGCSRGGNVFNFLMEMEGITFGEALRTLAEKAGVKLKRYQPSREEKLKDKLLEVNHLASEFYHYLLTRHLIGKKALDYLLKRGVVRASIKQFKLGYAPAGWRNLLDFLSRKKKYSPEILEKAGLVIKKSSAISRQPSAMSQYYDRFRGRIVFPLYDHRSRILGLSGRVLTADLKGAKYINTPETILYHKSSVLYGLNQTKNIIKKAKTAVVVEGEFDLISSFQAGVKNVVAIKGSALTQEQVKLLKRFAENIYLALDADLAGDAAARRGIRIAEQEGLNIRVIDIKKGKDPDEVASQDPGKWRGLVKKAIPIYDFYLNSSMRRFKIKTAEGKKRATEELLPLLAEIQNQVVKAHYLKKLAELLGVNEEVVLQELERQEKTQGIKPQKPSVKKPVEERSRQEALEEELLIRLLQSEKSFGDLLAIIQEEELGKYFEHTAKKKILERLLKEKSLRVKKFIDKLPAQLKELAGELYLREFKVDKRKEERELRGLILELKKFVLKEELQALTAKIKKAEAQGQERKLQTLEKKFVEKSKLLREMMVK